MTAPDSGPQSLEQRAAQRYHTDPLFHARVHLAASVVLTNTAGAAQLPSTPLQLRRAAAVALLLAELPPEVLTQRTPASDALERLMTTGDRGAMTWEDAVHLLGLDPETPR